MKYLICAVVRFLSRFQNGFQSERVWDNPTRFTDGRGGGGGPIVCVT